MSGIPIARPATGDEEWEALREVLRSGWLTQGPRVAAFERAFAERHGVPHDGRAGATRCVFRRKVGYRATADTAPRVCRGLPA